MPHGRETGLMVAFAKLSQHSKATWPRLWLDASARSIRRDRSNQRRSAVMATAPGFQVANEALAALSACFRIAVRKHDERRTRIPWVKPVPPNSIVATSKLSGADW